MIFTALVIAAAVSASPAATGGASPVAAPAGATAPPDGSYAYSIQQAGNEVGKSQVKIQRSAIGVTVHETETLAQGAYSFTIDEILDAGTLGPRAYTGVYARGTDSSTVQVAVDRAGATVTIAGTTGTAPFPNPPGVKEVYLLEGTLMSGFAMLPAQIHASKASQFSRVEPRYVLQSMGRVDPHPSAIRPSGVPAADVVLTVAGKVNFDLWYDPATFVVHALSVPSQQVLVVLTK